METKKVENLLVEVTNLAFTIRSMAIAVSMAGYYEDSMDKHVKRTEFYKFCDSDISNILEVIHEKADKIIYDVEMLEHVDGLKEMDYELW